MFCISARGFLAGSESLNTFAKAINTFVGSSYNKERQNWNSVIPSYNFDGGCFSLSDSVFLFILSIFEIELGYLLLSGDCCSEDGFNICFGIGSYID